MSTVGHVLECLSGLLVTGCLFLAVVATRTTTDHCENEAGMNEVVTNTETVGPAGVGRRRRLAQSRGTKLAPITSELILKMAFAIVRLHVLGDLTCVVAIV